MKGGKTPSGYTIIEVMIVLAISGSMFAVAANFISGRQARTSFTAGVNETASRIQNVISQVVNGQYTDIDVTCGFNGSVTTVTSAAQVQRQGKNQECVFLGKALHFNEQFESEEAAQRYETFSLAAGRAVSNKVITDLALSDPTPIPDLTKHDLIPQSLSVEEPLVIFDNDGSAGPPTFAIAFIQGQGSNDQQTGDLQNGPQTVGLYYVSGVGAGENSSTVGNKINGTSLVRAQKAAICVTDGTLSAWIKLGSSNNQLNVTTTMLGETSCSERPAYEA